MPTDEVEGASQAGVGCLVFRFCHLRCVPCPVFRSYSLRETGAFVGLQPFWSAQIIARLWEAG